MRVLGLICARGGSKGLPGKNIIDLGGQPLIAWTIKAAQKSRIFDQLVLSTDDLSIADVARRFGCDVPFMRPAALATDDALSIDVALHALDSLEGEFAHLVLLQPTSPFRTAETLRFAFQAMIENRAQSSVGVTLSSKSPNWMFTRDEDGRLTPIVEETPERRAARRQEQSPVYELNGAFYASSVERLRRARNFLDEATLSYVMTAHESIDIDSAEDLEYARFLLQQSRKLAT